MNAPVTAVDMELRRKIREWFNDKARHNGTYCTDNQYVVTTADIGDFSDFLYQNTSHHFAYLNVKFGRMGIWFTEKDIASIKWR